MNVKFGIRQWAAWAPGVETPEQWREWADGQRVAGSEGAPEVRNLPPLLRRRLERAGRAALHVAATCLGERRDVPMVFAARNGETTRTVRLLEQLASGDTLSPTDFGLSVHNATGGLYTIARQERVNCTALAAGLETLPHALIEAVLHLDDHAQVLLVLNDERLQEPYLPYIDEEQQLFAFALLLERAEQSPLALELQLSPNSGLQPHAVAGLPWPLQMVRWLCGSSPRLELAAPSRVWTLERCGHAA